jgi:hypothetical protein
MPLVYLEPYDPNAFVDHPRQQPDPLIGHIYECPMCHGYGGWNLMINVLKLPEGYEDTALNRHKYRHRTTTCPQCNGWGYVGQQDATCIHTFDRELDLAECRHRNIYHAGNCWHVYECSKCGKIVSRDSSG